MADWYWSWILTIVGVTGFVLAGRKVWWSWYVNIFCQFLWLAYALITEQYGFIVASAIYFVVFSKNAYEWTREHRQEKTLDKLRTNMGYGKGDILPLSIGFNIDKTQFDDQMRITQAHLRDISLVKEPPHPSWTIQSVDKKVVWVCTNNRCATLNYVSEEDEVHHMAKEGCPRCGLCSRLKASEDYGPGCGSCGSKDRKPDCPCPQVKRRGRDAGQDPFDVH